MYQKMKRVKESAYDQRTYNICADFLVYNKDAEFLIAKKYRELNNIDEELVGLPVILCTKPIEELIIPSSYSLKGDYITTWCDNYPLAKIMHSKITYTNGEIKGKEIKGLYLDIEKENEFQNAKRYRRNKNKSMK